MPLICEALLHFLKQRCRGISVHSIRRLGDRLRVLQSEQGRTVERKLRDSVLLSRRGETTSEEDTRGSASLVSRLVKQRAGVNALCLSSILPPPPLHFTSTLHPLTRARPPPPPLPYPNISPSLFQSWVNLSGGWESEGSLALILVRRRSRRGPWDTQVTSLQSCSISRARWNNRLPSGTHVKAVPVSRRSITLTPIKCFWSFFFVFCLFSLYFFIHFLLRPRCYVSRLAEYALSLRPPTPSQSAASDPERWLLVQVSSPAFSPLRSSVPIKNLCTSTSREVRGESALSGSWVRVRVGWGDGGVEVVG